MIFSDAHGQISLHPPQISLLDHGFLFGDSIYEVVRTYDWKIFGWKEHLERFLESARRLQMHKVKDLVPEIEKRAHHILKELGEPDAALRIFLTRGVGKLHIDPRSCETPSIYMAAWKFDTQVNQKEIRVAIPKVRRLSRESLDPAIKSGNYLNSVMAYQEAVSLGFDDALLLNQQGEVTELTTSNIGWIKGEKAHTPALGTGILLGVTRRFCLNHLSEMQEGSYSEMDLHEADEVFALSTFKEIVPVREVRFSDGSTKSYPAGAKTKNLQLKLRKCIEDVLKTLPKVC